MMLVLSYQGTGGSPHLGVIAKRAYRIHQGRCVAERAPLAICEEPVHEASSNPNAFERLVEDSDLFAFLKPSTDVVLSGSAHSTQGPVRMLDTGVSVGPLRKNVRVWGHRTIQLDGHARPHFSDAEPFRSLPLVWDHAYGGRDMFAECTRRTGRAEDTGTVAYPRNRAGRGFFIDIERERAIGSAAPQLEDPEDPILPERLFARDALDWPDRPSAACYGPVDWMWFPRFAWWLGTEEIAPSRPLYEMKRGLVRTGDLGIRAPGSLPDARAYNAAPLGLTGIRLRGGERAQLWNLHPKSHVLEFDLPGERPTFLLEPPGCPVYELPGTLQTIQIKPEEDRVILTWTGALEVAAPYPEEICNTLRKAARWER